MEKLKNIIYITSFVLLFSIFTTPFLVNSSVRIEEESDISYKVVKGDTLWSIGDNFGVENIGEFIFHVKEINNLADSKILVDQIIIIP
ncbi:MAG: LysM peptidoglycan-binding domain-containing protein [Candidatus Actinomarinaceae bacterium]